MSILYMKAILFLFNVKIFHQNKMSPQQLNWVLAFHIYNKVNEWKKQSIMFSAIFAERKNLCLVGRDPHAGNLTITSVIF